MVDRIKRKNGIISAEQTINWIKSQVPYFKDEGDLYSALIRVSKHHYGRRATNLTKNEMQLYDCLLKKNICPDTAYNYLRTYMTPDEVQQRYMKGKMSRRQMQNMGLNEIRREKVRKFLSILTEGRKLFEELDWRDHYV